MASFRCEKCGTLAFVSLRLAFRRSKSYLCGTCGTWHVHPEPPATCVVCGTPTPPEQDFPKKFLCQECIQTMVESMEEVQKGGVWWTCKACGAEGVFKAGSDLAKHFREKHLTFAPEPIGIQIPECPLCTRSTEKEEGTLTPKAARC